MPAVGILFKNIYFMKYKFVDIIPIFSLKFIFKLTLKLIFNWDFRSIYLGNSKPVFKQFQINWISVFLYSNKIQRIHLDIEIEIELLGEKQAVFNIVDTRSMK